jgi:hypothetical protein
MLFEPPLPHLLQQLDALLGSLDPRALFGRGYHALLKFVG